MATKEKNLRKFFFSKIFTIFFLFENYWKNLRKKNSKWLFWITNGMFLKKKLWNFEKINFFKILRFCCNLNYRTFPTSTTPKGKIRFFRVHMMSHLRKISLEPSNVPWESNLSVEPCDEVCPWYITICKNFDPQSLCSPKKWPFFTLTCHFHMEI